jgi:hypothetical protein
LRRIRHIVFAAVVVAALAVPAAAQADWRQAIRDCAFDGKLHHHFSQSELLQALRHLPPDINEYTDCYDVLRSALAGSSGGGGSSGSGTGGITPGSVVPTTSDLNQLRNIAKSHPPRVAVAGHDVVPGGATLASRTAANKLPTPLLWTLTALALMCALAGLVALRHRLPGIRRVALRILRR